jgi:hypothetical protein
MWKRLMASATTDITNMAIGNVCSFLGKVENPASLLCCCSTNKRKFSVYPLEEIFVFQN